MKFLIGLGNPGPKYDKTRHNIGHDVIESLRSSEPDLWTEFKSPRMFFKSTYMAARPRDNEYNGCCLIKTNVYMNLSGFAVRDVLKSSKPGSYEILVICDDANLALGKVRLRSKGSSGGQKGLESVIREIGDDGFGRLRVGIGSSERRQDLAEFVLSPFHSGEKAVVSDAIKRAVEAAKVWLKYGLNQAMNKFN